MEPNVDTGDENVCDICLENGSKCTETNALEMFENLNEFYRKRLKEIDKNGGQVEMKDLKIDVYEDWNKNICDMHSELIETICELEKDCINRLKTMQRTYEKNSGKFGKRLQYLETDKNSLIELIRRAREYHKWDVSGLEFHNVEFKDIFENDLTKNTKLEKEDSGLDKSVQLDFHVTSSDCRIENLQINDLIGQLDQKNCQIKVLHDQIEQFKVIFSQSEQSKNVDFSSFDVMDDIYEKNKILLDQLKNVTEAKCMEISSKNEENADLKKEVETLKEEMKKTKSELDSRVLVSEISEHFDKCRKLEHKLKSSQEKLRQANVTINYKSSVVSELRKENKRLNKDDKDPSQISSSTSSDNFISASNSPMKLNAELDKLTDASNLEIIYVKILKSELDQIMEQMENQEQALKEMKVCNESSVAQCNILKNELQNNQSKIDLMKYELVNMISCYIPPLDPSQQIIHYMQVISNGLKAVTPGDIKNFPEENTLFLAFKQVFKGFEEELRRSKKENDDLINTILKLKDGMTKLVHKQEEYETKQIEYEQREKLQKLEEEKLAKNEMLITNRLKEKLAFLENILFDLYKEVTFMIGKDVSDDSITSSISEMEVAPLQNLIRDLKKEISSKDCVLQSKKIEIAKFEDEICTKNKDLSECHRKLATLVKDNENYFQMIENLRNSLGLHDETIKTLKLKNSELQLQYEDMNFTLLDYRDNVHSILEEKAKLEEECKNQLLTISNLRLALENNKRVNTNNSSFFTFW